MHLTPFIFGFTAALLAVLIGWAYRHMSARHKCPECDARTTQVALPSLGKKAMEPWLQKRWCGHCGWQGLARKGPEFDRVRGPVSHDSGFHWNRRAPEAPRFAWGTGASESPSRRADDPSGFVWAPTEAAPSPNDEPPAAHPSGFVWSDQAEAGPKPDRRGFVWGEKHTRTSAPAGGFTWGRTDPPEQPRSFEWKQPDN